MNCEVKEEEAVSDRKTIDGSKMNQADWTALLPNSTLNSMRSGMLLQCVTGLIPFENIPTYVIYFIFTAVDGGKHPVVVTAAASGGDFS